MNTNRTHEAKKELLLGLQRLKKSFLWASGLCRRFGLESNDMPFPWKDVMRVEQVVKAICDSQANNAAWIRHVGSEIERLSALLEDFEQRAPTMVTIEKVVAKTDLEQAKRRLQPKRFFGRNQARPVRVHWGFA